MIDKWSNFSRVEIADVRSHLNTAVSLVGTVIFKHALECSGAFIVVRGRAEKGSWFRVMVRDSSIFSLARLLAQSAFRSLVLHALFV